MRFLLFLIPIFIFSQNKCDLPREISNFVKEVKVESNSDLKRNKISDLCISQIQFQDKDVLWNLLLLWNPNKDSVISFFLPHDDENTAFDVGVRTLRKFGGGMLAVSSSEGTRNYKGIDPNRNFKKNLYSKNIFAILDHFKAREFSYMSIHNNKKSDLGTVSMKTTSNGVVNFPAKKKTKLSEPDNLVYLVGKEVNFDKVRFINSLGMNVKYEILNNSKNDYSMSNYVFYNLKSENYFNVEAGIGEFNVQSEMVDKLIL